MIRWLMNEPFSQIGKPAILAVSQMQSREWRELSPDQYSFDRSSRIATVSLQPGDALRILTSGFTGGNVGEEKDFIIEELHISDGSGGVSLTGDQVNKSFLPASRLFGPETTFVFTYK